jgi:hypothetical protein
VIVNITCFSVKNNDFDNFIGDKIELFAIVTCQSESLIDLRVIYPSFPPMSILISSSITFFQVSEVPMREYVVVAINSKGGVYLFCES